MKPVEFLGCLGAQRASGFLEISQPRRNCQAGKEHLHGISSGLDFLGNRMSNTARDDGAPTLFLLSPCLVLLLSDLSPGRFVCCVCLFRSQGNMLPPTRI